jgi:hypothetical protein
MRRAGRLMTVFAAGAALLGLAMPSAVASGPAQHFEEDVTGEVLLCETANYTITSGSIKIVLHEGASASGNLNFTGTITPQQVVAVDDAGNLYSIRGAEWFGFTENAQQGTFQATFTGKLQVVAQGSGTTDSVNVTQHITVVNGNIKDFDFGTCVAP